MPTKEYNATVKFQTEGVEGIKKLLQNLRAVDGITDDNVKSINGFISSLGSVGDKLKKQLEVGKIDFKSLGLEDLENEMAAFGNKISKKFRRSLSTGGNEKVTKLHNELKKVQAAIDEDNKELKKMREIIKSINEVGSDKLDFVSPEELKQIKDMEAQIDSLQAKKSRAKKPENKAAFDAEIKASRVILNNTKLRAVQEAKKEKLRKKALKIEEKVELQGKKELQVTALINLEKDKRLKIINKILNAVKKGGTNLELLENQQQMTKATEESAEATKNLNKIDQKHGQTLMGKVATGMKYYLVLSQLRKLYSSVIRTVTELDEALTQVAMVTTMNRKEAWGLLQNYQSLAKQVGMTTTEVANLSIYFFRQGRSARDALQMTEVAAKAAKVAAIDATESANYLTSAINGFGLAASQAEAVSDRFAALGAASASSYEELAKAMSKVAPAARVAGIDIDHMMGFIAKGIETTREAPENIGTAFKTIFSRMRELKDIGKTMEDGMDVNKVDTALKSIGVTLRDSSGQFRDLQDVINEVGSKWSTLDRNHQSYIATALAGTRQQSRLLALFQDYDRTLELVAESQESSGAMAIQHSEYMEGMGAAVEGLKNAWQGFITTITESEVVIGFVRMLATSIDALATVISSIGAPAEIMLGLLGSLTVAYIALNTQTMINVRQKIAENLTTATAVLLQRASIAGTAKQITAEAALGVVEKMNNIQKLKSIASSIVKIAVEKKANFMRNKSRVATGINTWATNLNTAAEMGNTGAISMWILAKTIEIGMWISSTIAAYGFATSLVVATGGLILIVPLIVGLVVGLVKMVQQAKDGRGALASLGGVFKGLFKVVGGIVKIFFELGKTIGNLLGVFIKLYLKISGFEMLFKWFSYSLKQVSKAVNWVAGAAGNAADKLSSLTAGTKDYSDNVKKLNKEAFELKKQVKTINKIKDAFDELNSVTNKTPEQLEEMNSKLQAMQDQAGEDYSIIGKTATGKMIFNEEEYNKYISKQTGAIASVEKKMKENLIKAIDKGGEAALKEKSNDEIVRQWLYEITKATENKTLTREMQNNINKSLDEVLGGVDLESQFTKNKETWWGGTKKVLDEDAMKLFADSARKSVSMYYETFQKESLKRDASEIGSQIAAINAAIRGAEGDTALIEEIKSQFYEAQAWLDLNELGISVTVLDNLSNLGFSPTDIQSIYDGLGMEDWDAKMNAASNAGSEKAINKLKFVKEAWDLVSTTDKAGMPDAIDAIRRLGLESEKTEQMVRELYNTFSGGSTTEYAKSMDELAESTGAAEALLKKHNEGSISSAELIELSTVLGAEYLKVLNGTMTVQEAIAKKTASAKQDLIDELELLVTTNEMLKEGDAGWEYYQMQRSQLNLLITNWDELINVTARYSDKLGEIAFINKEMTVLQKNIKGLSEIGLEDTKLYTGLTGILETLREVQSQNIAKDMTDSLNAVDSLFTSAVNLGIAENGIVIFDPEYSDEQMDVYNDYMDAVNELSTSTNLYTQFIKTQADEIKKAFSEDTKAINSRYKSEIDSIKLLNSEKWKQIKYEDKLLELNEKLADLRVRMAGAQLDSTQSGELDKLQKEQQKLQREKQKLIEDKIMAEEIKLLENEKDEELKALEERQITAIENLTAMLEHTNDIFSNYLTPEVNPDVEVKPISSSISGLYETSSKKGQEFLANITGDTSRSISISGVTINGVQDPEGFWKELEHHTRSTGMQI